MALSRRPAWSSEAQKPVIRKQASGCSLSPHRQFVARRSYSKTSYFVPVKNNGLIPKQVMPFPRIRVADMEMRHTAVPGASLTDVVAHKTFHMDPLRKQKLKQLDTTDKRIGMFRPLLVKRPSQGNTYPAPSIFLRICSRQGGEDAAYPQATSWRKTLEPELQRELQRARPALLIDGADGVVRTVQHSRCLPKLHVCKVRIDVAKVGAVEKIEG